jgi:hypothetical protein
MSNEPFSQPLFVYFNEAGRRLREEIERIDCSQINRADSIVKQLVEKCSLPIPEFNEEAKSVDFDDKGLCATYTHDITHPEVFRFKPSIGQVTFTSYEASTTATELKLRFNARQDSIAARQFHKQVAAAIYGTVAALAGEITYLNASLERIAATALNKRRTQCEEKLRRRKRAW